MKPAVRYCIEGQYVTAREIAERTGLAINSVWNKMKRGDATTWDALAASAGKPRGQYKPRRCEGWH